MRGYQVIGAHDGVDALEQIIRVGSAVDLLLTDVRMPRMGQ
jgi:CheY-like chemotaxis protein